MELIERYISEVTKRLPPPRRQEAASRLHSQIDEKLRARTGGQPAQDADIEAVLLELGDPTRMADQIRGSGRFLIGPDVFEVYWLVLRIVLLAVGFGMLVATAVQLAANPPAASWSILSDLLGNIWNALVSAFGMVTLIFALIEYFNPEAKAQLKSAKPAWHPRQLPPKTASTLVIKRAEPIAAMIFMVIFLVVINFNLDLVGIYLEDGDWHVIPVFSDYFRLFIPWINLVTAVAIILEAVKLITGRWNIALVAASLVQKAASLVISIQLFSSTRLFDSRFFPEIRNLLNQNEALVPMDIDVRICRILLIITIAGFVLDVLTTGWKAVRIALDKTGK